LAQTGWKVSLPYQQPQGGTDRLIGTANTKAEADAEFAAKADITAGVGIVGAVATYSYKDDGIGFTPSTAVGFNADLVFKKGSLTRTVGVQNMIRSNFDADGELLTPVPGLVDDFAAAWRDSNGVGGYTCIRGHTRD